MSIFFLLFKVWARLFTPIYSLMGNSQNVVRKLGAHCQSKFTESKQMDILKLDTNLWWRIWLISSIIYSLWWDTYFSPKQGKMWCLIATITDKFSVPCLRHKLFHIQAILQCAYPWKQAQYGGFIITPEQIIRSLELLEVDKAPSLDEWYP